MLAKELSDRNKLFTLAFLLLLLLSSFVVVSHHHENTVDDHDCPICIANNHQSAAGLLPVTFDGTPCLVEITIVASAPINTDTRSISSRSTRAPPA